jgi:hypothetical protein
MMDLTENTEKSVIESGLVSLPIQSQKRRKITFNSFRRYVKQTISNMGFKEFSEFYIGHAGSPYYDGGMPEEEIMKITRKIEPSLTLLDITSLEKHGADIQSKTDSLETEIQRLWKSEEAMKKELLDHKQKLLSFAKNENKEAVYNVLLVKDADIDPKNPISELYGFASDEKKYWLDFYNNMASEQAQKVSALEEQIGQLKAQMMHALSQSVVK